MPCFKQKYFHRRSDQNLKTFTAVLGNKCTAFEPFAEQAPSDLLLSMRTFQTPRSPWPGYSLNTESLALSMTCTCCTGVVAQCICIRITLAAQLYFLNIDARRHRMAQNCGNVSGEYLLDWYFHPPIHPKGNICLMASLNPKP